MWSGELITLSVKSDSGNMVAQGVRAIIGGVGVGGASRMSSGPEKVCAPLALLRDVVSYTLHDVGEGGKGTEVGEGGREDNSDFGFKIDLGEGGSG